MARTPYTAKRPVALESPPGRWKQCPHARKDKLMPKVTRRRSGPQMHYPKSRAEHLQMLARYFRDEVGMTVREMRSIGAPLLGEMADTLEVLAGAR